MTNSLLRAQHPQITLTTSPVGSMYYPLTPPPQPYIPRKDGKSMMTFNELLRTKAKIDYIPTKEEIAASINTYVNYDMTLDAYKFCYEYKNRVTNQAFRKIHVMDRPFHCHSIDDAMLFNKFDWDWRKEFVDDIRKMYDEKKKELIKEKIKMLYGKNFNEITYRLDHCNAQYSIKSCFGYDDTIEIKLPINQLERLFSIENDKGAETFDVTNIETYNDRVVKMTFSDGTFTKSVCQENDIFDLDVGMTVCLIKKMLGDKNESGTKKYNDIIRKLHRLIEDKENEKIEQKIKKDLQKKKARKAQMNKQAKKMKAKEEAIDIQKQAIIRAYQEMELMKDGE